MEKIPVKIFDISILSTKQYQKYENRLKASKSNAKIYMYDLDDQIVVNGQIFGIDIDDEDTIEYTQYKMDKIEKSKYLEIKKNIQNYTQILENEKANLKNFEHSIIDQINNHDNLFEGEYWDCCLSPLGRCIYHIDDGGELSCIFCGKPEERK